jgi:DNA-binding NarL/FixJ family response regulator
MHMANQWGNLAHGPVAPTYVKVTAILVVRNESFRERLHQRLLEADCDDVRVAEPSAEFAPLLFECRDAVVILGGRWPDLQPLLRTAVKAKAPTILLLQQQLGPAPRKERGQRPALLIGTNAALNEDAYEALRMGASAVLDANIAKSALAAAIAASHSGLIVLDNTLKVHRESHPSETPHDRSHRTERQLTMRERKILSLVAGGVSNKGIARNLGVSVNTVKFHLAAAFEKLNVATRAEAVAEGIRRGELSV